MENFAKEETMVQPRGEEVRALLVMGGEVWGAVGADAAVWGRGWA